MAAEKGDSAMNLSLQNNLIPSDGVITSTQEVMLSQHHSRTSAWIFMADRAWEDEQSLRFWYQSRF